MIHFSEATLGQKTEKTLCKMCQVTGTAGAAHGLGQQAAVSPDDS